MGLTYYNRFFWHLAAMSSFKLQNFAHFEGVGTIVHEVSMPSTSDVAKSKLRQNAEIRMPLLVLCDQQTAGRGQRENTWESDHDSLTFTWCISVDSVPAANHPLLPLITGISVCEAIESIGIANAKLKWPNDVLIDRQKVCGILVEKISSAGQAWFLIGVGINVNQTAAAMKSLTSSSSSFRPGSLRTFLKSEIQIQSLLENVLSRLHENTSAQRDWSQDLDGRFDFLGEQIKFTKPDGNVVVGFFRGVDELGRIKIDVEGETNLFTSGQLS